MNLNFLKPVYMEGAGGDGGSGGGGDEPTLESLTAQLADITKSNDSLKAKNAELLGETKQAKTAKREAEEAARVAAETKAKADGDHEQLYKSSEAAREKTQGELDALKGTVATEKCKTASMKIAAKLADGSNVDLLSDFIVRRLKYSEGEGLKVTNASGELTVSTMDDLENEFKNDARYMALLKGNQSSGGGAGGGDKGGGAAKVKTRAEFDALNQADRMTFTKSGGKVTN